MRTPNRIRAALAERRTPVGMQCFSGSAPLVEIMGHTGFDFVMIDTEHTCIDDSQVEQLVRVAENVGMTALVRVAENNPTRIRKALEAGAAGVIVPQVRSAADIGTALEAMRYPPDGSRGMCPSTRAAQYSIAGWDEYVRWTNADVMLIPILENPDAIGNVEAICSVPEVEIVLFGPGDLGQSMGFGSQGMLRPELQAALDHVIAAARGTNKTVMAVPFPDLSANACRALVDRGVGVIMHSVDELLFYGVCKGIVDELRPILATEESPPLGSSQHGGVARTGRVSAGS